MTTKPRKTAKAKSPTIAPEAYNAYLNELHLGTVRMVSVSASLERPPSEDETLGFDIQFDFGQLDTEVQEAVVFMVTYKIEVDGEDQSLVAVAEATYAVECTAPGPPPPGFLEVFGPMNLSRLVYPFFREQVAGITAKMELPTLFVPLNIFGGKRQATKEKMGE